MITGGGEGQGIQDIYNKLGYINEGLLINETPLKFYTETGTATPINISAPTDRGINLTIEGNNVTLGLVEVNSTETSVSQIIKSITVDKFGRVIAVSGSALTNEDLPSEIVGKTIKEGKLDGCTTVNKEIAENELAVVNKAYVDAKFNQANGVATGALKFGGPISDATTASNALSNKDAWNSYYKVTSSFDIAESDLEDTAGLKVVNSKVTVKAGDTLIVYPPATGGTKGTFICIPSADDVTRLTVKGDGEDTAAFTSRDGEITLRFSEIFDVTNPVGSTALISLPYVTAERDGYLTKEDYARFKDYSNNLAVSYKGEITSAASEGIYKIGTLTVGSGTQDIYGRYNISSLSLNNGTGATAELNPVLKFTETGKDDVDIALKGTSGVVVRKSGNDVEFIAANEVDTSSTKYLEITSGYKFKTIIGKVENQQVVDGLTDYNEFATFRSNVITSSTIYEVIDNSLSDTTKTFYYGSTSLKAAVALEEDTI